MGGQLLSIASLNSRRSSGSFLGSRARIFWAKKHANDKNDFLQAVK